MLRIHTLESANVQDKRVLLRVDLNLPIQDGRLLDDSRILHILPTIQHLKNKQADITLCSHFGRPDGQIQEPFSLIHIIPFLEKAFNMPVHLKQIDDNISSTPGAITLLENLRFDPGEITNDPDFAKRLARWGDIYINDAFSVSHRAHASVCAITKQMTSVAGLGLVKEIKALSKAFNYPQKPVMAVIGGAKISSKIQTLASLVQRVQYLVPVGGIANMFLKAMGHGVGRSLVENQHLSYVDGILKEAEKHGCTIILPQDVHVTDAFASPHQPRITCHDRINATDMIADFGPESTHDIYKIAQLCHTVIWNGPFGVFEHTPFDRSSLSFAHRIADLTENYGLFSVAGGGETLAVLNQAGVKERFSHASTAGGAFLAWLEGDELPGVDALKTSG